MTKKYLCAKCKDPLPRGEFHEWRATDRRRPVSSRCARCRSEDYYTKRYKTVCAQCLRHRPLDKNQVCAKCNAESGLRQCHGPCNALLPLYMEFDKNRKTCKKCRKDLRASSPG